MPKPSRGIYYGTRLDDIPDEAWRGISEKLIACQDPIATLNFLSNTLGFPGMLKD